MDDFTTHVGMSNLASKLGKIGPKFGKKGKCTETDLKKSHICQIWGQCGPIWMANLTSLHTRLLARHGGVNCQPSASSADN